MMAVRDVRVMAGPLMVTCLMVLRGCAVVPRSLFVMFRGLAVVFSAFVRHRILS